MANNRQFNFKLIALFRREHQNYRGVDLSVGDWIQNDSKEFQGTIFMQDSSSVLLKPHWLLIVDLDISVGVTVPLTHHKVEPFITDRKQHFVEVKHTDIEAVTNWDEDRYAECVKAERNNAEVHDARGEF